jgi:hypothetical protein
MQRRPVAFVSSWMRSLGPAAANEVGRWRRSRRLFLLLVVFAAGTLVAVGTGATAARLAGTATTTATTTTTGSGSAPTGNVSPNDT